MKMIPFGKSLEMSVSLHFVYISSYMHTFICSISISIDISKMNKFIENLAKLFNKATSFSCHKKNNAIVPDNPNSREHFSQIGSWDLKKRYIVSPTWNTNKLQGSGKWKMSNETSPKWWIVHIQLSILKPRCIGSNHQAKSKKDPLWTHSRYQIWIIVMNRRSQKRFVGAVKWRKDPIDAWFTWREAKSCWKLEYT